MKNISKIIILCLAVLVSGCGTNMKTQNGSVPQTQNVAPKTQTVRQLKENKGSYKVLNTNLDQTYYKDAIGKTGTELKRELHQIISKQDKLSYGEIWKALGDTDQDPNHPDNVILLYEGRSVPKTKHEGSGGNWNREHVWAKSHGDFGTRVGPGTDLHNLKPEDKDVNSARGNLDFDITEAANTKYLKAPDTYWDNDSWEPRDEVKGDIARIILYMDARYEGNGEIDLDAVDQVTNRRAPKHGKLSTLLKWHREDPVDDFEKRRNQVIYEKYQHNRNPFIDHPEWVDQIWGQQAR
ncbi:ribonuclease [Paenibacillus oralis]|uniref:Ribonuclease n=1 Tax=Paenibacillus oralis TaxID=2490856 RepID=A0A3P3U7G0_9BACL|nr:endonuclease [Paenibacillus oralis]RRJ65646.1 ribonuclease [Paenibacillus oralis]